MGFGRIGVHADEHGETVEPCPGAVGVQGCGAAFVPGVPGHQQIKRFGAAHFADQDPVGPHAQRGLEQRRHGHVDAGVVLDVVLGGALDFAGVLDDENPFGRVLNSPSR
jgi:hypothetical protein